MDDKAKVTIAMNRIIIIELENLVRAINVDNSILKKNLSQTEDPSGHNNPNLSDIGQYECERGQHVAYETVYQMLKDRIEELTLANKKLKE